MYNKVKYVTISSLVCTFCVLAVGCEKPTPQEAKADTKQSTTEDRKVLVVHSYHPQYEWVAAITRGLQIAILPTEAQVEYYYMDTKRRPDEMWMRQSGANVMELIEQWQPDVVITVDDNAQDYVGRYLAGREHPSVVFCGVNAASEVYGYPAGNVTGVLERLHFNESLAFFKMLQPEARRIVLLSDDSSTSRLTIDYIKTLPADELEVVDYVMPSTFDEWKQAVDVYGRQVDAIAVYTYHTVRTDLTSKQSLEPREVMDWTVQNSPVPIIGFLVFAVDDGSLCGVLESGVEQGRLAGQLAVEILNGKCPADLPIITGVRGQTMINMKMATLLGLKPDPKILEHVDVIVGKE